MNPYKIINVSHQPEIHNQSIIFRNTFFVTNTRIKSMIDSLQIIRFINFNNIIHIFYSFIVIAANLQVT